MTLILSMMLFAFVGAATPGPVNLVATASGVHFGFIRTLPHVIGASMAYATVVLCAGFGLTQMLFAVPILKGGLFVVGSGYLLWIAYQIFTTTPSGLNITKVHELPSIWRGALMQWLNPKAWLVASSGIGLFVIQHAQPVKGLVQFSVISLVICFVGVGIWALFGHGLHQLMTQPAQQKWFNRLMGVLLIVVLIPMMLSSLAGN